MFKGNDLRENNKIIDSTKGIEMKKLDRLKATSWRIRGDGRVELRFYRNGRQHSVYGQTQEEVLKKYRNWKPKIKTSLKAENNQLFNEKFLNWQKLFRKNKIALATYNSDLSIFNKYISPFTTDLKFTQVSAETLQKILNNASSVRRQQTRVYDLLNMFFRYLNKSNQIRYNPVEATEFKRTSYIEKGVALSKEEEDIIVNYWFNNPSRIHSAFLLMLSTGMRPSEIITINGITDVDRKNFTIHIRGTKTKTSDAIIQYTKNIVDSIPYKEKPYKFSRTHLSHTFKNEVLLLGLNKKLTLKSLRKTFATRCMQAGMPNNIIAYILRHTSTKTTQEFYLEMQNDYIKANIKRNPYDFTLKNTLKKTHESDTLDP